MRSMRYAIVFDISSHGFGHLAQTGPVIDRIHELTPDTRLVVRTKHTPELVGQFLKAPVEFGEPPAEATMVASDVASIDLDASARAYRSLHAYWDAILHKEVELLRRLRPTAVVSNINPMSLAAGRRLGLPALAMCSMNWRDIYSHYFGNRPEASAIIDRLTYAYSCADLFLQLQPHMPMSDLTNLRSIPPIARRGKNRRETLRQKLGLTADKKILLLTLGGAATPKNIKLPLIRGAHWLVRGEGPSGREDVTSFDDLGFSVLDLTFSSDAVICKDSYCSVVEAALAAVKIVIAPRPDWPEVASLLDWVQERCGGVLAPGGLADVQGLKNAVLSALDGAPRPPVCADGVEEAAIAILEASDLHSTAHDQRSSRSRVI